MAKDTRTLRAERETPTAANCHYRRKLFLMKKLFVFKSFLLPLSGSLQGSLMTNCCRICCHHLMSRYVLLEVGIVKDVWFFYVRPILIKCHWEFKLRRFDVTVGVALPKYLNKVGERNSACDQSQGSCWTIWRIGKYFPMFKTTNNSLFVKNNNLYLMKYYYYITYYY